MLSLAEKKHLYIVSMSCRKLHDEHIKQYYLLKKISYGITIPILLADSVTFVLATIGKILSEDELRLITGIVLGVSAFGTAVKEFSKLEQKIQYNLNNATNFNKLADKIEGTVVSESPEYNFNDLIEEKINLSSILIEKRSINHPESFQRMLSEYDDLNKEHFMS